MGARAFKVVTFSDAVTLIALFACILSFFGSLGIIITYWTYPRLRKPARHLLLWLSISDFFTSLSYSLNIIMCDDCNNCSDILKLIYTINGIFWPVSSFLWTDCIALYIFGASYQKKWIIPTKRLFSSFHIISWFIPFIIILIIIFLYFDNNLPMSNKYTGGWCWVQKFSHTLIGGKLVEICSYIFLIFIYSITYFKLRKIKKRNNNDSSIDDDYDYDNDDDDSNQNKINELLTRLTLIPLIFLLTRLPGTLRVLLFSTNLLQRNDITNKILQILQALCDPLQGFCNSILFLFCVSAVRKTICNCNILINCYCPQRYYMNFDKRYYMSNTNTTCTNNNTKINENNINNTLSNPLVNTITPASPVDKI